MQQFRNWRWYKGLGGGPIVDLGSHQIDIYNWFLGATPSHVMASGGLLLPRSEDARVVRHRHGHLRLRHAAGPGQGVLPDADDQRQPGLLRELHGRPGDAAHLRVGGELRGPALPRPERAGLGRVDPEGVRERAQGAGGKGTERLRRGCRRARVGRARPAHGAGRRCATPTTSRTCRTSSTPCAARRHSTARPRSATRARSASSRSTRRSRRSPGCRSSPRTSRSRGAGTWKA